MGSSNARLVALLRSRRSRFAITTISVAFAVGALVVTARHFAESSWPLSGGNPLLVASVGLLLLVAATFKAFGWRRLFAHAERPRPFALAAANGGASLLGVALPGRFDDVVRVAIVRRYAACPAGLRTICLSLVMLGLIDTVALAPFASAIAASPGQQIGVRAGLALVAAAGVGAATLVVFMPQLASSARAQRWRLGRWLDAQATSPQDASRAWTLVSVSWLIRAVALLILFGALGVGFSMPLAVLFLVATAAAAALPLGPAGAVTQAGAGAAALVAAGIGPAQAIAVAVAAQLLAVLAGGAILAAAIAWQARLRFMPRRATA